MARSILPLVLTMLALAAGVWWITAGTQATAPDAVDVERVEAGARAAPAEAALTHRPARPAHADGTEPAGPAGPAPAAALETRAGKGPRRAAGEARHDLRFRLEDDRGDPVQHASFTYTPRAAQAASVETASSTGDHVLRDLPAGDCLVAVHAYGLDPDQEPAWHAIPGDGEPIVLTFVRRGAITGRVVDGSGVLIPDLPVYLTRGADDGEEHRLGAEQVGAGQVGAGFHFPLVRPGAVTLSTSNGFVAAELELVVAPGDALEDVELRLDGGATVQGRVLDAQSEPAVGVDVIIVDATDFRTKVRTGAEGAFRIGPILPGTYEVTTVLKENADDDVFDQIVSETVTVARGDVVDLLLQPRQETPVVLRGRITYGGERLPGCVVYGFRENEKLLEAVRMARSNDEGEYELKLGGPGSYVFLFEPRENRSDSPTAPLRAEIPDAATLHMDLALPASSIQGRVLDADGEPVAGAIVLAVPSDDYMDFVLPDSRRGFSTDSRGVFTIPYVAPGEYVVRARTAGGDSPLAWEPVAGVRVHEGAPTRGIDLRAVLGATVTGVVRGPGGPSGEPVAGAAVYAYDGAGALLFLTGARTDAAGEFRIAGVPEGAITLTARAPGRASPVSEPKSVRAGEEVSVELRLASGSLLTATAVDAGGAGVSCAIHVLDASGRDVTRVTSAERAAGNFTDALSTTTRTVGPLPAGEYRVVAATRDGRSASRRVKVDGERDTQVDLRF